jgi:4-oxalocrotonate tautomerase
VADTDGASAPPAFELQYHNFWRNQMPLINVRLIEGVFTPIQKKAIVERLTEAMVQVEGENLRPVTWVVIDEVKSGDWGIGGKALTTQDVKLIAAGRAA